nr:reverse transcriptase domain-containing protein [Tanacetum cinerariifolium]
LVDIFAKKVVTPALFKAVEESCVTCGGVRAYYNCSNIDSKQTSVCVATGTYNQVAPQNRASNFMAPLGFAPVQNSQNSFADALLLMPKFASTIKSLLANKDTLFELAKVPLNENCSAMLMKKLPEKLGDPGGSSTEDFSFDPSANLRSIGRSEQVGIESSFRNSSISSREKSLSLNGVSVNEEDLTIGTFSEIKSLETKVGLLLLGSYWKSKTSSTKSSQVTSITSTLFIKVSS